MGRDHRVQLPDGSARIGQSGREKSEMPSRVRIEGEDSNVRCELIDEGMQSRRVSAARAET